MEFKDYYKIMGLSPDVSQEEIKRTYRKLARKYHPDVSRESDAESKFKEVGEAYEVLKDPEKRGQYDALRQQGWRPGQPFNGSSHGQADHRQERSGEQINPEEFSDFFESLFGYTSSSNRHQSRSTKGEDIHYVLEVSLEDSYHGATRSISFPVVRADQSGHLREEMRSLKVKIPKGVTNGQQIRLKGQGGPAFKKGHPGDLYLEIRLMPKEPFQVDGKDVHLILPVTPWEAALGSKVKVPTLGGVLEVKIPVNAQAGSKLRLKGRGLPGDQSGDQIITLQVFVPPAHTEKARKLYLQMAEQIPYNPREKLGV